MSIFSRRSLKAGATAAGLTVTLGVLSPAAASADIVDDVLNRFPSGQISCEQANSYWTDEADYNDKRSQALLFANIHPRGDEIREALARVDEAANRCGLTGGDYTRPAPEADPDSQPGQPGQPAQPQPSTPPEDPVSIPVGGSASFDIPALLTTISEVIDQLAGQFSAALPSWPGR